MDMITVKDGAQIYYKDWGNGQPIVFSHVGRFRQTTGRADAVLPQSRLSRDRA